jgi:hypothetical protein
MALTHPRPTKSPPSGTMLCLSKPVPPRPCLSFPTSPLTPCHALICAFSTTNDCHNTQGVSYQKRTLSKFCRLPSSSTGTPITVAALIIEPLGSIFVGKKAGNCRQFQVLSQQKIDPSGSIIGVATVLLNTASHLVKPEWHKSLHQERSDACDAATYSRRRR